VQSTTIDFVSSADRLIPPPITLYDVDERTQSYCPGAHRGRFFGHRFVQNTTENTNSTQRLAKQTGDRYSYKIPQVIHKNFKISRIRNFYMRKVKFTQDSFDEKLGAILTEFPMLDVRYSALMGYLYIDFVWRRIYILSWLRS
jgi:hypothetical protein